MNWYKKAQYDFQRGEAVIVMQDGKDIILPSDQPKIRYYIREDDKAYYLSMYGTQISPHTYIKFWNNNKNYPKFTLRVATETEIQHDAEEQKRIQN